MATSKFNKVVQKNNITYTNLNMRNATNGFKTRKHVYRYAKKSLVGGSAGSAWRAEVYKSFIDNVAQLIPDTKAQTKVSSDEFNKPITINNTQFPNNIILYAFIIFYCLKVHNFKINTTEDGTKNKLLLTGLVDILIGVLNTLLKNNNPQLKLIETNALSLPDELFNILDIILREGNTTKTKALDAVKVENYFTIDAQKTYIARVFSKSKISSITINVVLETNVLKNPVDISFNTALEQPSIIIPTDVDHFMTTPPDPDIVISASNSIKNSTKHKFDNILTHIKNELVKTGITIDSDNTECNTIDILKTENTIQLKAFIKSLIDKFVSNNMENNWSTMYMSSNNKKKKKNTKIDVANKDVAFVEHIYNEMVQTQHSISNSSMPHWHKLFEDIVKTYNDIKLNVKNIKEFNDPDPITQIDNNVGHTHTHSENITFHNTLYERLSVNLSITEHKLTSLISNLIDYIFTVLFALMYYCIILLFDKSVDTRESLV